MGRSCAMRAKHTDLDGILESVWRWSEARAFKGYNKHDGLNSPILRLLFGWAKWPRIIAIQSVMRFPFNIRPLLLVRRTYNPKGIALFAMGCMNRYECTGDVLHLKRAERLLELLRQLRSKGSWSGTAWGYHYPWQDLGFYAPSETPNAVVTSFVCNAFLQAYRLTDNHGYLGVVKSAVNFFKKDLVVLVDEGDRLCLSYMPLPMTMRIMDVSVLIGSVVAKVASIERDARLHELAHRLVSYVVGLQTDYGAWYYTDPPSDSLIKHDNYHTGFILDALWDYMEATDDWNWKSCYEKGLAYYAEHLFTKDGAPKWMNDRTYPLDIHGSAQGIITFSRAISRGYGSYMELLDRMLDWSIRNMYNDEGKFSYQKTRRYKKRFVLLRWCNAWMFRAISEYILWREEH